MAGTSAPDPGWRIRLTQGLALSMLFPAFFGGLVLLDGWFSRRLVDQTERTVMEATTVIVALFWPCFLVMYLVRIRKSARQCRLEFRALQGEEKRVDRVRHLLQAKHDAR